MDDFGFTIEPEVSTLDMTNRVDALSEQIAALQAKNEELAASNREMYSKICTLLINLKRDPEKPIIKWPNREQAIDKFIDELKKIKVTK